MNGLSWLSHEWVRCLEWIVPVRFYQWSQAQLAPLQTSLYLSMNSYFTNTIYFKNGAQVKFGTGTATFADGENLTTVMIANDALLEAMADYLSKQDADTLRRFVHLFAPAVLEVQA